MSSKLKKAKFSIDEDPEFKGYHIPGDYWNGFEQPCFDVKQTKKIAKTYNSMFNEGQSSIRFSYDKKLNVVRYYPEKEEDGYIMIEPITLQYKNKPIQVFELGLGLCWMLSE